METIFSTAHGDGLTTTAMDSKRTACKATPIRHGRMHIKLGTAEQYYDSIRQFRQTICVGIGLDVNGVSVVPLPYAFYLFAFAAGSNTPVGMAEFFFYEQAFGDYSDSVYNQAFDLATIAPRHELVHARSLIIAEPYRRSRLFLYLCGAMIQLAHQMGGQYLTASTGLDNPDILGLHTGAGMRRLGCFMVDGSEQQISVLHLPPTMQRLNAIKHQVSIDMDSALAVELRARKCSRLRQ